MEKWTLANGTEVVLVGPSDPEFPLVCADDACGKPARDLGWGEAPVRRLRDAADSTSEES